MADEDLQAAVAEPASASFEPGGDLVCGVRLPLGGGLSPAGEPGLDQRHVGRQPPRGPGLDHPPAVRPEPAGRRGSGVRVDPTLTPLVGVERVRQRIVVGVGWVDPDLTIER